MMNGIIIRETIVFGEAICAGMAVLLLCHQEGGIPTQMPLDLSLAPGLWSFVVW
jgi:hypothetical protein